MGADGSPIRRPWSTLGLGAGRVKRRRRAEERYRRLDALLATMSHTDDKDGADDVNDH